MLKRLSRVRNEERGRVRTENGERRGWVDQGPNMRSAARRNDNMQWRGSRTIQWGPQLDMPKGELDRTRRARKSVPRLMIRRYLA